MAKSAPKRNGFTLPNSPGAGSSGLFTLSEPLTSDLPALPDMA
jgi:hypothetical protein